MTRLAISGHGYVNASQMLGDGNRQAAVAVETLSSVLADGGAMAGDSSFASEFAAAYDEAAVAVLGGFDDVVGAFASLSRLAYASLENHERAERASTAWDHTFTNEPSLLTDDLYTTTTPAPPASLGGDPGFLPDWANVILDHVEGFVWPDADVDRLRTTAAAWREAAERLDYLADLAGRAINELFEERSPEIMPAADAVAKLGIGTREVAVACRQLGSVCDDYATSVETQRELILDLVRDLIRDAILIQAAGFVLGFVSGGGTNAIAMWINSGKLGAQVPRFKAFVEAVRLAGAGAASTMRAGTQAVVRVRADLVRLVTARRFYVGERGARELGSYNRYTWLGRHEGGPRGAHTLRKHVGKSDRFLERRLRRFPKLPEVSTFTNETVAERSIRRVVTHYADDLAAWLAKGTKQQLTKNLDLGVPVGRIMTRDGVTRPGQVVRVIIRRDPTMPDGFRIHTSFVVD